MRNRHRRIKCSSSMVVWILVGIILLVHFYTIINHRDSDEKQLKLKQHMITRELEEVEEEKFQIPPPRGKRSPRAVLRRGPRKPRTAIDEFLNEASDLRNYFFPSMKSAFGPTIGGNDSMYYYHPAKIWLDTDGHPIQAHGGGILFDQESDTYYWYGENKDGETFSAHKKGAARVDIIGVSCYSSKDLWTWKNEGVVLHAEETNTSHDLYKSNVLERPKVIHNRLTNQYVMWMHIDDANYTKASVGVATSESPTGPFTYLYSKRPHGFDSRDMTLFQDTNNEAYLIYSSMDNTELHVTPFTDDYLALVSNVRRILIGQHREAPAVFKHEGTYYMITSGCTGWAPNKALAYAAESVMGPWELIGNPCVGGNNVFQMTTFFSQSTFVLPLPGLPGFFIFMADRWNPSDLRDSRYVWLPLRVGGLVDDPMEYNFAFPLWSRVSVYWHKKWRLPKEWKGSGPKSLT